MAALIVRILTLIGRFGSLAALLGTLVNTIVGAIIVASSLNLYENLTKIRAIRDSLDGPIKGSFIGDYYRIANLYLPLTECMEFVALSVTTAGAVLLVRILWRVKSISQPKNPLTGV